MTNAPRTLMAGLTRPAETGHPLSRSRGVLKHPAGQAGESRLFACSGVRTNRAGGAF